MAAQVRPMGARDLTGVAHAEDRYGRALAAQAAAPSEDAVTLF